MAEVSSTPPLGPKAAEIHCFNAKTVATIAGGILFVLGFVIPHVSAGVTSG